MHEHLIIYMALLIKTSGNVKCRFSYLSKLISGFIRFIMGNLLKILSRNDSEYCCVSVPDNVFVDFENSKPKEDEVQVYNLADAVLKEGAIILEDIKNYKGNKQSDFREMLFSTHGGLGCANRTKLCQYCALTLKLPRKAKVMRRIH